MGDVFYRLSVQIKEQAKSLGFDRVGIAPAEPSRYRDYFRQWLDEGRHGTMSWLAARFEERTDPSVYLPGARSVLCVAMNYFTPLKERKVESTGRIARYALGDDYHEIITPRLHTLADWLRSVAPEAQTKCAVDTAPVMEKELAARAGVGWLGKNCCIINEEIGSWILLGEILTTLALPADEPAIDRCGTCTRCLDACPTGAITAPYQIDASRCISYLTIEHRTQIQDDLQRKMGEWIYGCDVCQDVCPWNRRAPVSNEVKFAPRFESGSLHFRELESWTPEDYQRRLSHSAMKRVKLPVLQRNGRIASANQLTASSGRQ